MKAETKTKLEEIYWVYLPFVRSLRRYLRQRQGWKWNRNHNWNWWSRRNTKGGTISTATGNHPRRSKRSSTRRRGGILLQEGGIWIWINHGQRSAWPSGRWPYPSTVWLRDVQVGIPATPTSSYIIFTVTWMTILWSSTKALAPTLCEISATFLYPRRKYWQNSTTILNRGS